MDAGDYGSYSVLGRGDASSFVRSDVINNMMCDESHSADSYETLNATVTIVAPLSPPPPSPMPHPPGRAPLPPPPSPKPHPPGRAPLPPPPEYPWWWDIHTPLPPSYPNPCESPTSIANRIDTAHSAGFGRGFGFGFLSAGLLGLVIAAGFWKESARKANERRLLGAHGEGGGGVQLQSHEPEQQTKI